MKTIAINLAAAAKTAIRSFADGNIFRESNCDQLVQDVADHLGYLTNALDGKANLAGSNTMTGLMTFAAGATPGIVVNGDNGITTNSLDVSALATFTSDVQITTAATLTIDGPATVTSFGQLCLAVTTLADANATIGNGGVHFRVPAITANRAYTLPASTGSQRVIRLERLRTADAFTATLQAPGPSTMGIVSASAAGWIEVVDGASGWVVTGFGGTVTSIATA